MSRVGDFKKNVKRAAWERSGGTCEASGAMYGLPPGARCRNDLRFGVVYDHIITERHSHDGSLENCLAICPPCNRFKTDKRDAPMHAKADRQRDRHMGIKSGSHRWPKRKFAPSHRED